MALQLGLLRHAKSSWDQPALDDYDRPLNSRGERDAPAMGRLLKAQPFKPGLIVSSGARRALSTAQAVARELEYAVTDIVSTDDLYLAQVSDFYAVAASHGRGHQPMLLVSHNPGITDFVNTAAGARIDNIPTTGFALLEFPVDDWHSLQAARAILRSFLYPKKDLRRDRRA